MLIGTTCSSGLVAANVGCNTLTSIPTAPVLVMAASLIIRPVAHIAHSLTGGLSRAGRCHTLDERADGFARSEAIIAAVLRSGSSSCMIDPPTVCSDGRSASFTAPNGQAQRVMIAAALSSTGLMADEVSYYEAHGTGTKLGDPTEVSSSAAALLRPRKEMIRALAFGGVKSHVGHVEPGAGLVGLLVLACALKAERVPPNAQLRVMNEHVDEVLRGLACEAGVHESELLPEEAAVGGVSSFGINGTIAHALVRSRRDAAVRGASVLSSSQLRALNPLVRERLGRASSPFVLPAQEVAVCGPVGGVSSFGYSGTIAHAVLRRGAGEAWMLPPAVPVIYRRHAFPWREASAFPWLHLPHPCVQHRLSVSGSSDYFRSSAAGCLLALVADHIVQGRVIFPGAGYLEVARAALTTGVALRDIFFLQPLDVEAPGLFVECVVANGLFEVRSCGEDAVVDATVHCTGAIATTSGGLRVDNALAHAPCCVHGAHVGALYDSFDAAGLQYGPGYRTVTHAWGGTDGASARLRSRSSREGTQVHPADLDDALCTSAIISSSGSGDSEARLPFAIDGALLQGVPGNLWAVRRSQCTTYLTNATPTPPVCPCS